MHFCTGYICLPTDARISTWSTSLYLAAPTTASIITLRTGNTAPPTTHSSHLAPSMLSSSSSLPLHVPSSPFPPPNGSLPSLTPSSLTQFPNPHQPHLPSSPLPNSLHHKDLTHQQQQQQQMDSSAGSPELSVYICMPNLVLLESGLVICKCFCRPDDFCHLYPRSTKKTQVKFTRVRMQSVTEKTSELLPLPGQHVSSDKASVKSGSHSLKQGTPKRVRLWRGVEIHLVEGKKLGEVRQMAVRTAATDILAGAPAASKSIPKEDCRNSTGAFLPTGSQIFLLSINKDALFNKPPSFAKICNSQKPGGDPPAYRPDEPKHAPLGFQFNCQSIQAPPATSAEEKLACTPIPTAPNITPCLSTLSMTTFTWSSLIGIPKLLAGLLSDVTRTPFRANPSNSLFTQTSSKSSHHYSTSSYFNSASSPTTVPSQLTFIGQIHLDCKAFEKNGPV
ncbi:hypothetical protein PCASD_17601 [Puccinia coronata f. sp. avenae]|uniref:Uncharacterized protein n=1 Tax=Puccinia coronata f. sp. avenae TaxID=200324 RepID=A0A2N5TV47_9BASI|nr:hypothetical protein PCASD_17601 [Puccinia coronata f. sp. avenae]